MSSSSLNSKIPSSQRIIPARIGVALGGGSARGYAHIGALASLENHGLSPSVIVGTSFGAIIGSLYASGQSLAELRTFASGQRRRDLLPQLIDFGLHKAALFRGDKLEQYFDSLLEGRHFSDLERNFAIVATDVDSGQRVLLQDGPLATALRASASMPGIFAPVELGGKRLMDGGIGAPVPLDTLEHFETDLDLGIEVGMQCEESISIRFAQRCLNTSWGNRVHTGLRDTTGTDPLRVLGRTLAHTFTAWQTTPDLPVGALNIHTKPPINWLHFHRADEAIAAGEEALEAYMPTIKQALLQKASSEQTSLLATL
ncbi:MAG: patatin-like phospholipase family protein [Deinococcota bacterium]